MSNVTNYYQLTGAAAQIADFCSVPFDYAVDCLDYAQEPLLELGISERIANYALSFFIVLASLPLYLVGVVVQLMYREEIPLARYEEEKNKWTHRFHHYGSIESPGDLNLESQKLIDLLIRSRKSVDACPFEHILCCDFGSPRHLSSNILAADGRYPGFKRYFDKQEVAEKSLIIGCAKKSFVEDVRNYVVGAHLFAATNEVALHGQMGVCHAATMAAEDLYPTDSLSSNFKKHLVQNLCKYEFDNFFTTKMRALWMEPLGSKLSDRVLAVLFPGNS